MLSSLVVQHRRQRGKKLGIIAPKILRASDVVMPQRLQAEPSFHLPGTLTNTDSPENNAHQQQQ